MEERDNEMIDICMFLSKEAKILLKKNFQKHDSFDFTS
jgi:hypothetical protein